MTDLFYVDSGCVASGYSAYVADGESQVSINAALTCDVSSPIVSFSANLTVTAALTANVKKHSEFAAALTADFASQTTGNRFKGIHADLSSDFNLAASGIRIREVHSAMDALASQLSIGDLFRNDYANLLVTTDLTARSERVAYANVAMDAFVSQLTIGNEIHGNRVDLDVTADLAIHNERVREYHISMVAFASEMALVSPIRATFADLAVTSNLSVQLAKITGITSTQYVDATLGAYNYRVSEAHASLEAFASQLALASPIRDEAADLTVTSELAISPYRLKGYRSDLLVTNELTAQPTNTRPFAGDLSVDASLTASVAALKDNYANLQTTSSLDINWVRLRVDPSQLDTTTEVNADVNIIASGSATLLTTTLLDATGLLTKDYKSDLVVNATQDTRNYRVRNNDIETDVIASQMSVVGRVAAFFINCDVVASLACQANIQASGKSVMATAVTQTTVGVLSRDYRSNMLITALCSGRITRNRTGSSNLVFESSLNTSIRITADSTANLMTDVVTALTRTKRIRHQSCGMAANVALSSQLNRIKTSYINASATVSLIAPVSKKSNNSSHMDVTATSLTRAYATKSQLADLHLSSNLRARPLRILDTNSHLFTHVSLLANAHLFYLDDRYGWTIAADNYNWAIPKSYTDHRIEYEERTSTIGVY